MGKEHWMMDIKKTDSWVGTCNIDNIYYSEYKRVAAQLTSDLQTTYHSPPPPNAHLVRHNYCTYFIKFKII